MRQRTFNRKLQKIEIIKCNIKVQDKVNRINCHIQIKSFEIVHFRAFLIVPGKKKERIR